MHVVCLRDVPYRNPSLLLLAFFLLLLLAVAGQKVVMLLWLLLPLEIGKGLIAPAEAVKY